MHFEPAAGAARCRRSSFGVEAQWQWHLQMGLRASVRPVLSCPRYKGALGMPQNDALPLGMGSSIHSKGSGSPSALRSSTHGHPGSASVRSARPVQALPRGRGASSSSDALSAAAARPRSASPSARSGSPPHAAKPGPGGIGRDSGVENGMDCAYVPEAAPRRGRGRPRKSSGARSGAGRCEASAVAAPGELDQAEAEGDMPMGKFQCRKAVPCNPRVKSHKLCSNCISRLIKSQGEKLEASALGLVSEGPLPSFAPDDWSHEEPIWLPRYASLAVSSATLTASGGVPLIQIAGVTVRGKRSTPGVPGLTEPEEKRPMPKTFQGLLSCYVNVREEVQAWSDFFKANNGRRPKIADVEATRLPWLVDKFAEYLTIRATLERQARSSVRKAALYAGAKGRFATSPPASAPVDAEGSGAGRGAGTGADDRGGGEEETVAGASGFSDMGFTGDVGGRESERAALERRWDAGVAAESPLLMDEVDDWVFSLAPSLAMGAPGEAQHRRGTHGGAAALGDRGRPRARRKTGLGLRLGDTPLGVESPFEGRNSTPSRSSDTAKGRRVRDDGIQGIPLLDAWGTHVMGVPDGPLANQWEMLGFQSAADSERRRLGAERSSGRASLPLPWMPSTGMGDQGWPVGTPKALGDGAMPSVWDEEGVSDSTERQAQETAGGARALSPGPEAAAGVVGSQDVLGAEDDGVPRAPQGERSQGLGEGDARVSSRDVISAAMLDSWPVEGSLPPAWRQVPGPEEKPAPMAQELNSEGA